MPVVKERYSQNKFVDSMHTKYLETKFIFKNLKNINKIAKQPSYFPENSRKKLSIREKELLKWLFLYKDLNIYYNMYGQDLVDCQNYNDYIAFYEFVKIRREELKKQFENSKTSYEVILQDKIVFNRYFSSILGKDKVTNFIGQIINGKLVGISQEEFFDVNKGTYVIVKPLNDDSGHGVIKILVNHNSINYQNEECSFEQFLNKFKSSNIILEGVITQHKDLAKLNPSSVNTLRIVSYIDYETLDVNILGVALRIGTKKEIVTDNWGSGGVGINVKSDGKLDKFAFYKSEYGTKIDTHPISKIVFENYQVPSYQEAIDLVKNAHQNLSVFKTIGWDIAITEKGALLVEGNPDWMLAFTQSISGPIKKEIYKAFNIQ